MKSKFLAGLTVLSMLGARLALCAPPAPAAPPPPPPPTVTSMVNCYSAGSALAQCAVSWEHMVENGNKVEDMKSAWEVSGFTNYVTAISFLNQDTTWCDASGTLDNQAVLAAVAKFIRENPDKVSSPAAVLTNTALKSTFPCVKKAGH